MCDRDSLNWTVNRGNIWIEAGTTFEEIKRILRIAINANLYFTETLNFKYPKEYAYLKFRMVATGDVFDRQCECNFCLK